MAEQIIGDRQSLGKSPVGYPSGKTSGGTKQIVGDSVPLPQTSTQSPSADPKSGTQQLTGDRVTLGRTPIKGWPQANTPMSERAKQQSKVTD